MKGDATAAHNLSNNQRRFGFHPIDRPTFSMQPADNRCSKNKILFNVLETRTTTTNKQNNQYKNIYNSDFATS